MEREHERDEFQQEIHRLEAQLRQPTNVDHRGSRVRAGRGQRKPCEMLKFKMCNCKMIISDKHKLLNILSALKKS